MTTGITITSIDDLNFFGIKFREEVSKDPIPFYYAKTTEEFRKQVAFLMANPPGHTYALLLQHHKELIVSVALTLDIISEEGDIVDKGRYFHLSCVEHIGNLKMRKIPDLMAHELATSIAGPNWKEISHPGTMIPDIRHFFSPVEESMKS
jgi:hypothetical protein